MGAANFAEGDLGITLWVCEDPITDDDVVALRDDYPGMTDDQIREMENEVRLEQVREQAEQVRDAVQDAFKCVVYRLWQFDEWLDFPYRVVADCGYYEGYGVRIDGDRISGMRPGEERWYEYLYDNSGPEYREIDYQSFKAHLLMVEQAVIWVMEQAYHHFRTGSYVGEGFTSCALGYDETYSAGFSVQENMKWSYGFPEYVYSNPVWGDFPRTKVRQYLYELKRRKYSLAKISQ